MVLTNNRVGGEGKMKKDSNTTTTNNEEIMNRVNETFDKIADDVKAMIKQNDASDNVQYS